MIIIALLFSLLLIIIDQILKFFVMNNIPLNHSIDVIKFGDLKLFNLTNILNDGAGWSIFSGKTAFLIIVTSLMLIAIIVYMIFYAERNRLLFSCFSLIIAGGIGNLIDRVFRGGNVIDYIQAMFIDFPVFNFADICVVFGVILFIVYILFFENKKHKHDSAKDNSDE